MKLYRNLAVCAAIAATGIMGTPVAAVAQTPPACTTNNLSHLVTTDWRLFSNLGDCTSYVAAGGTTSLASNPSASDPTRISILYVAEVSCVDEVNTLLADKYGPGNLSIALAPQGMGPATHYAGHLGYMSHQLRAEWQAILTEYLQNQCLTLYWTDGVGPTQVFYDIGLLPLWWFAPSE